MANETQRLFLALPLPLELKQMLAGQQEYLKPKLSGLKISWIKKEQMHLTLIFLGDIPSSSLVSLVGGLRNQVYPKPFHLRIGGLGVFPNMNRPRVIWVGLGGDLSALHKLHEDTTTALKAFEFDRRKLKPHLTLARLRRGFEPSLASTLNLTPKSDFTWTVDCFSLYKSDLTPSGAVHEVVANIDLLKQVV